MNPSPGTAASALAELIYRCAATPNALKKARQIHAVILTTTTPYSPPFLNNSILSLYAKSGSLKDASQVFDAMPTRNLVSYNAIISACSRSPHHAITALRLFPEMLSFGCRPNGSTFTSLLQASTSLRDPFAGAMFHSQAVRSGLMGDAFVPTALLRLYSDCRDLESANTVFGEMGGKDIVAWNAIIHGNLKSGFVQRGLQLFSSMMRDSTAPTEFTFSIALSACRKSRDRCSGEAIHARIIKSEFLVDVPLQNALLDMYSSCGDLASALIVFREIETPVLVSWNSLISGYSDNGDAESAMDLFIQLRAISSDHIRPDDYTYAAVVSATAALPSTLYGKPLHAQVEKVGLASSVFVGSTLISMYFNNQEPDSASKIFSSITDRDAIIWTEMIVHHSQSGEGETAVLYFYYMIAEGHRVDSFSLSSALNSSADLAALRQGEMIHSQVVRTGYETDICVCGSLVDMYAKNGNLKSARSVFDRVENPDLKCWNAMLGGYGNHGNAQQAFELFNEIIHCRLQPDQVTFLSLLSACSHCCLVERGRHYWGDMLDKGLVPGPKHYSCMANLLSRVGFLQEAEELIRDSPFADKFPELWRILLSSCVIFKELSMGIHAAERVLMLEPDDSSTYILLSNLYASVGKWENVAEIRRRIRGLVSDKDPGLSWIEIKDKFHTFSADDEYHSQVEDARAELHRLQGNMKGWEAFESMLI